MVGQVLINSLLLIRVFMIALFDQFRYEYSIANNCKKNL